MDIWMLILKVISYIALYIVCLLCIIWVGYVKHQVDETWKEIEEEERRMWKDGI